MGDADAQVIPLDPDRGAGGRRRCEATTSAGRPCRNYAGPSGRCRVHARADATGAGPDRDAAAGTGPAPGEAGATPQPGPADRGSGESAAGSGRPERRAGGGPAEELLAARIERLASDEPGRSRDLDERIEAALAFLRRRVTGDYEIDEFGFDRELTEQVLLPLLRPLYHRYWRVRTVGADRVPGDAGALVVANHSGTVPFDALMTKLAVYDDHPARRHLRELAADLAFRLPVVAPLARKFGNTLAHNDDATRLLESDELTAVWPEGYKGIGKGWRNRYKLQRFGRGGFVEVALRTGRPIIPVAIVGAEEAYPMIADVRILARLLGFPYFPVTVQFPWLGPLGLLPLPSKWVIEFGEPIETTDYGPDAADDPMLVFELTDRVRDTIQQMLYRNLMGRRSVFL